MRPTLITISLLGLAVTYLSAELTGRKVSYGRAYWFFELCHLAGGFFTAMLLYGLGFRGGAVIGLTFAVGVFWEAGEYLFHHSRAVRNFLSRFGIHIGPFTWGDTLLDLVLDIAGAAAFLLGFGSGIL